MGTLYDLLGALPGDDAEGLRAAFRRAAKATHPDMNPDDPEASRRFRELMRAYDILTDADQRSTYDELLRLRCNRRRREVDARLRARAQICLQHDGGNDHFGRAGRRLHAVRTFFEPARRRGIPAEH